MGLIGKAVGCDLRVQFVVKVQNMIWILSFLCWSNLQMNSFQDKLEVTKNKECGINTSSEL